MQASNVANDELLAHFWRDGYAVVGSVLSAAQLVDCRSRYDALFFDSVGRIRLEVRDLSEKRGVPLQFAMLQRVDLWKSDQTFRALVTRDDFLSLARSILGPRIRLFRDQGFYKPPSCGAEVYMHQDNRYWHLDPPAAMTFWIALDDATIDSGCMHYIKGSHRWGPVDHGRAANGESILLEALVDRRAAHPIEVRAGNCVMHHCLTVHYTPVNVTERPRRAYSIQYMAADVSKHGVPAEDYPLLAFAD